MAGGHAVVSETHHGMRLIMDGAGAFGYATADGVVVIAPEFCEAGSFQEGGFACVADADGLYRIIDVSGNTVYAQLGEKKPVRFDGRYLTFLDDAGFGVADKDFVPLSDERFENLYDKSVFGEFLVCNPYEKPHRFYSLADDGYVGGGYETITPVGGYFLAKTFTDRYVLYDARLSRVAEAEYLAFDGAILLTGSAGIYHYYTVD